MEIEIETTPFNISLPQCGSTEECDFARFVSISILSFIACIGAASNLLLTFIFTTKKYSNAPPTLYPTFLAILDSLICIFYVLMFGVDVIMIYLKIETLFVIYHYYIVPAFVLAKITQLAIPYMLIFVTMERYAWISENFKSFCLFTAKGRPMSVILCLIVCAVLRAPFAAALVVEEYPECLDFFRTLAVSIHDWAVESKVYVTYDFHIMTIIHVFVPFVSLLFFNSIIVYKLSLIQRQSKKLDYTNSDSLVILVQATQKFATMRKSKMSKSVKNAVVTTLAIVTSYLVCNSLHMFLTVLERTGHSILKHSEDENLASTFYTIFADSISALYMLSSATRIVIYCKCNPVIYAYVLSMFTGVISRHASLKIRERVVKRRMSMFEPSYDL
uniref:G-protein coupled receptors family 1 profile domain-containing protein n=1 Tax=Acrobeloides nanus TaxID=290746 RepID=A0A914EEM0_9BILA